MRKKSTQHGVPPAGPLGERPRGEPITITLDGEPLAARAGEPVAVALFEAGVHTFGRSSKYHRPRGPFCFDGHCAACYMRVDGRPNRRACMTEARDGLACERQNAFPSAEVDLLAAADWLFPEGMDHHHTMTASRVGNALFLKLVRQMGGSGTLPTAAPADERRVEQRARVIDVCIVGGGPAGLAAAQTIAAAAPKAAVVVIDEQSEPGGSLLAEPGGWSRGQMLAAAARAAGAEILLATTVIGYYGEDAVADADRPAGVLVAVSEQGLLRVRARRYVYATGAYDQNLPFADNDRPGIVSARACGRLAFRWGVDLSAADRPVVIADAAPTGGTLAAGLGARGVSIERVDLAREAIEQVRGAARVRGVTVRRRGDTLAPARTIPTDLVAVAALPAPASELPRQHGAEVGFDPAEGGFATQVNEDGMTSVPDVYACGDVAGYRGTAAALRAGKLTGRTVAATLSSIGLFATAALAVAMVGCATGATPPAVSSPSATSPPPATAPPAAVEPPPFQGGAPATVESRADARTAERRAIFDGAWRTVRDKHYDKQLGGLDWNALRAKYEPLAIGAPSAAAFYRVVNQMLGELGQSHMMITGPGAEADDEAEDDAPTNHPPASAAPGRGAATSQRAGETSSATGAPAGAAPSPSAPVAVASNGELQGDPGLTVRVIEGRPTITRVRAASSADRAGLLPGFIVTQIAGRPLAAPTHPARPLRPVEERFAARRAAQRRLLGPVGSRVSISYLDDRDRPGQAVLVRDPPRGSPVQIGNLPPLYPEVRAYEVGRVGVIAFNLFLIEPVLADVKKAMSRFASHGVRAIVLDLRGNPGGQGAMAIPVASMFVDRPLELGTLKFRDFNQTFVAKPELGARPFLGPLAILVDEGTASTSEMLAAGLQEAKRATVVGDTTLGAVLPSVVEALPGGAVMQYPVADFRTPKGVLLEGRGVQPDRRVIETRAGLKAARDPVLDAALVLVKGSSGS